jgi:uncharacterized protein YjiK
MAFLNFGLRSVSAFLVIVLLYPACSGKKKAIKSPPHYDFSKAFVDKLDPKLNEISGIAWDPKTNVFLAINDEAGKLFYLGKDTRDIVDGDGYEFGAKGDYEDVTLYNGVPFALKSDGSITRIMKDSTGKLYGIDEGKIGLTGKNDFETIYADTNRRALVLICKSCAIDTGKSVSAFAFYPDSLGFVNSPIYKIDGEAVDNLSPFKTSKLQPSAAAIHPKLQKLFIVSSSSHQLVITDLNGKPEGVYELGKKLFPQPEGIAFKQSGDMIISNESGIGGKPSVVMCAYSEKTADSLAKQQGKLVYDFSKPDDKMELGKHLHEISGMAYVPGKPDIILTENDEKGDIFKIDFKNKQDNLGKLKFGGKADYEDIVHTRTAEYMLVSTGSVVQVETEDSIASTKEFTLEIGGKNEFESMYLDDGGKSLILLCKECAHEKDEKRAAYRFDLATQKFSTEPAYIIDINTIRKILGDDKAEFKPSAAGINPVSGKLFIVASVGKLLVIASKDGVVEQVYKLDPNIYNQPEGLTFAPNGDLYISNEGGEGIATILKFDYKK